MSSSKNGLAVGFFFLIYILSIISNPGFMGTDEYWTGITRYIPAQEKNLHNMMEADDVKSPTQMMPLLGLSHLALNLGLEAPYDQYRFVQILIGLFSTILLGLSLLFFLPKEKYFYTFLSFAFYFAGAFGLTRPMFESLSAPWILLSALSLQYYLKNKNLPINLKLVIFSVIAVSIAFLLRPQTGICALGLLGFLAFEKDWKALVWACLIGLCFFILAGIPDIYLRDGFHSSLKGILFYNIKHGASYDVQPWFFYIPLVFLMMWGPFWISRQTKDIFKKFWAEHKVYWVYIIFLITLHSLFPQKWERFVIPVLGLMILILSDWFSYFWKLGFKKRMIALAALNTFLWIPTNFFTAQKNIIEMSLHLDSHPEIKEVIRFNKSPQWITEVFIRRKDWTWLEVDALPAALSCNARLVMNLKDFKNLNPDFIVEEIFETNLIEKVAYRLNPEKNLRRTPLILLKNKGC